MDVVLTPEGLAPIQAAAPGHVAAVRETFIDRLSAQDLATLDRLSATVIDGLHNPSHCPNPLRNDEDRACASSTQPPRVSVAGSLTAIAMDRMGPFDIGLGS